MTDPSDEQERAELRARLRAADPARRSPTPPDTWIQDLTEATMSNQQQETTQTPPPAQRRTWLWAAAAAVVVILGIGAVLVQSGGGSHPAPAADDTTPTVTELKAPEASSAKCMVPSARVLSSSAQTAFDGTVVSIDDDRATLEPSRWYAGQPTDQVVVVVPAEVMESLVGAVDLELGKRYLLAGSSDGHLLVCGMSAPYDPDLAALYASAFAQ